MGDKGYTDDITGEHLERDEVAIVIVSARVALDPTGEAFESQEQFFVRRVRDMRDSSSYQTIIKSASKCMRKMDKALKEMKEELKNVEGQNEQ